MLLCRACHTARLVAAEGSRPKLIPNVWGAPSRNEEYRPKLGSTVPNSKLEITVPANWGAESREAPAHLYV